MRAIGTVFIFLLGIVAGILAVLLIDVRQTREGRLPEISFEGGQLPQYEFEVGNIEVTDEGLEITPPRERVTRDDE
jgi:hypothetical protein